MTAKAPSKTAWRKSGLEIIAAVRRASATGSRSPELPSLTYLDFAVLVALSEWLAESFLTHMPLLEQTVSPNPRHAPRSP